MGKEAGVARREMSGEEGEERRGRMMAWEWKSRMSPFMLTPLPDQDPVVIPEAAAGSALETCSGI